MREIARRTPPGNPLPAGKAGAAAPPAVEILRRAKPSGCLLANHPAHGKCGEMRAPVFRQIHALRDDAGTRRDAGRAHRPPESSRVGRNRHRRHSGLEPESIFIRRWNRRRAVIPCARIPRSGVAQQRSRGRSASPWVAALRQPQGRLPRLRSGQAPPTPAFLTPSSRRR